MSPATTPLKPTSASTPLTIISTRIDTASRLPPKTGAAKNIESAKKKSQARMSSAYATEGYLNDRNSGSHDWLANAGWRLNVRMAKCRLQVTPASTPMKTTAVKLSVLACGGAQECTATMSATITGIITMIRTSRIENIGSPIGCCGDLRDKKPTASVTA